VENMIWSQRRRRRRRQEEEEEEAMMMMLVTRHPSTSRGSGEREFQVGFTTGMQITAAIACENTSTRVEFRFPTPQNSWTKGLAVDIEVVVGFLDATKVRTWDGTANHEFPFLFPEFLYVLMPPCTSATRVLYASRSVVVVVPSVAAAKVRSSSSSS
jgi:hypothetical protein